MEILLNLWKQSFYTDPILFISNIIILYISIKKKQNHFILKLFPIYLGSFLILSIIFYCGIVFLSKSNYYKIFLVVKHYTDFAVTLIELFVFGNLLLKVIKNWGIKNFITWGLIIIIIGEILLFTDSVTYQVLENLYIIEDLFLLIPCVVYFVELFRSPPILKLLDEPSFWVVTGLFFFVVFTLPVTLLSGYLKKLSYELYVHFYAIVYLSYILLFLMICKAYLCKPTRTR
jgi:hypothetical protein